MKDEEFEKHWLELAKRDAKENQYEAEILKTTMKIIDEKDYRQLFYIMKNYDGLVKAIGDKIGDIEKVERDIPFWCICFGFDTRGVDNGTDQ